MSETEHDAEFEAFLKRRSPMHRRLSDFDHAEPSVELDRMVLGRAREAITVPSQAPVYRATRWAMPLGLAATILIAFTVLLNIEHRDVGKAAPMAATGQVSSADVPATAELRADSSARVLSERVDGPATIVSKRAIAPAVPMSAPPGVAVAHADAESWLREIADLRAAGKTAEADRELVAFRQAYPRHAGAALARPPTK